MTFSKECHTEQQLPSRQVFTEVFHENNIELFQLKKIIVTLHKSEKIASINVKIFLQKINRPSLYKIGIRMSQRFDVLSTF
jgi:hypothetical protein